MLIVSSLRAAQAEIASRMRQGEDFGDVETEVIDPAPLPEEEKAALWLYGWSFVDWRLQRREATAHLRRLERAGG
jgi:hypothetical protein